MNDEQDTGRSYILRPWPERAAMPERPAVWRFSLTDTSTGERRGFGCLQDLVDHLALLMDASSQSQGSPTGGSGQNSRRRTKS